MHKTFNPVVHQIVIALLLAIPCVGQSIPDAFGSIARIESDSGRGTGFVVAKQGNKFELWTNAHVVRDQRSVTLRFFADTDREFSAPGLVVWSKYDGTRDAAKIISETGKAIRPFGVTTQTRTSSLFATAGYPSGNRGYAILLSPAPRLDFGPVSAYLPESIPGQSGSPVVDRDGNVTHVVTLRAKNQGVTIGGALPISHWADGDKFEMSTNQIGLGIFEPLPNASNK